MSTLSTHVLDAVRGEPAVGVAVSLHRSGAEGGPPLAEGSTDGNGRVAGPFGGELAAGGYRLVFATAAWFGGLELPCFYPEVVVSFTVDDERHYHVPLLLSPYGYSTYRGS